MRMFNQVQPSNRLWFAVLGVLLLIGGTFWVVGNFASDLQTGALTIGGVLALIIVVMAARVLQVAIPMKREREIFGFMESLAASFAEKVGGEKRQSYFTAKKRFEAAAQAIGAANPKAMALFHRDLARADALVPEGRYEESIPVFETLAKVAADNRNPAYDPMALYSAVQQLKQQQNRRKSKSRSKKSRR